MKGRVGIVTREKSEKTEYSPTDRLIILVGNYGSGKTEVAVNLAIRLALAGRSVQIADLDIVNPYFRCREVQALMERHGVRVVVPPPTHTYADLPIIVPAIKGMLHPLEGQVSLFDVGGDEVGAKLLSSFVEPLGEAPYALWQVINARRPFTGTLAGCLELLAAIEESSRLRVTGLVVNTHLMDETTAGVILEGYDLAMEVSEATGLPVVLVAVMERFADLPELGRIEVPVLRLKRHMLPPWRRAETPADAGTGKPAPIDRP